MSESESSYDSDSSESEEDSGSSSFFEDDASEYSESDSDDGLENYRLAQKEVNLEFNLYNLIQYVSKISAKSRRCRWTCSFASALESF